MDYSKLAEECSKKTEVLENNLNQNSNEIFYDHAIKNSATPVAIQQQQQQQSLSLINKLNSNIIISKK